MDVGSAVAGNSRAFRLMGPAVFALHWVDLIVILRSLYHILVVTVALVDVVLLADALTLVPSTQTAQN
jgi:hypothetical protein